MVYKSIKYGNVEDVTVIDFGQGTLSTVTALAKDHSAILIKSNNHTPIGEQTEKTKGISSDKFYPEAVLSFRNVESLNVLMAHLRKVKKQLLNKESYL